MGLFGGFKAKFSKDSVAKNNSKSSKNKEVVCLGYRVYSEFADPPRYSHQPPPENRPLPVIKVPLQKRGPNSVANSSAATQNSLPSNRNTETTPNKDLAVAKNRIPNGLTSTSVPSSQEDNISARQNGRVANQKAKQKNGTSPKPATRTAILSQDNAVETPIITNAKAKKSTKKKAPKDVPAPRKEAAPSQDETYICSTIPKVKDSKRRTKSNSYVTENPTCVEVAISNVNPASNDRLAAEESEISKTPPKSILKAKPIMDFQKASKYSSSNTLSVSKSSKTVTHSATNARDQNPVNRGLSQNTQGIGNTSSFAANLFFAVDDDDDDDDDDGGVNPCKNRGSVEC